MHFNPPRSRIAKIAEWIAVAVVPLVLAMTILGLWHWDFSIPLVYAGSDDTWQLVLTKMVTETGWILNNPHLGAPATANWHFNPAAQTSSIHSFIMLAMTPLFDDAVRIQQVYYVLNFSLISLSSYLAARTLGVARVFAGSIALLFSFTSFRIGWMFYAYLANYFSVPLALIPVFWIMTGRFANPARQTMRATLGTRDFWVSLSCIAIVALSDGYYAFFTVLLIGFAILVRVIAGDWRVPSRFFMPIVMIMTLMAVVLGMSFPLSQYQRQHHEEFYPGGKIDISVQKQPFEAEVYSSSLKLLFAPIPEHRIHRLGSLGEWMVETSNAARKYPQSKPIVSLGTLGSLLFVASFIALLTLLVKSINGHSMPANSPSRLTASPVLWAAITLSMFIFLCSTSGGIGALLALVYPTIRAYDRFPLFLIFCLFIGGGVALTSLTRDIARKWYVMVAAGMLIVTAAGIFDQVPYNAKKGSEDTKKRYLAERALVQRVENALPSGSMVYQYPHSQYQSDNKYYGWGSFAHIRLYLHSSRLRWSNGASRNSPVETWLDSIQDQPVEKLASDIAAVGFSGMFIDRTVVSTLEYKKLQKALQPSSLEWIEDPASKLVFVKLADPGYRIHLNQDSLEADDIVVESQVTALNHLETINAPDSLDTSEFKKVLLTAPTGRSFSIHRGEHPRIFVSREEMLKASGNSAIQPITAVKGKMTCRLETEPGLSNPEQKRLLIELQNDSDFPLTFGRGAYPLGIGFHLLSDRITLWDNSVRLMPNTRSSKGATTKIDVPLARLSLDAASIRANETLQLQLVQDGNAWFEQISCSIPLR